MIRSVEEWRAWLSTALCWPAPPLTLVLRGLSEDIYAALRGGLRPRGYYGASTISSSVRTVRQFRMVLVVCNCAAR